MENAYTAVAEFDDSDGKTWKLQFDYEARAATRTLFGKSVGEAFADVLAAAQNDDLGPLCSLLAISAQRHQPGTVAADMRRASPPVGVALAAIQRALMWSINGPNPPPEEKGPAPAAAEGPITK